MAMLMAKSSLASRSVLGQVVCSTVGLASCFKNHVSCLNIQTKYVLNTYSRNILTQCKNARVNAMFYVSKHCFKYFLQNIYLMNIYPLPR